MKNFLVKSIIFDQKGWLLWGCLFSFFYQAAWSQEVAADKARIRDFGVIRGRVIEYDVNNKLIFLRKTGDTVVLDADRVVNLKVIRQYNVPTAGTFWHSSEFGLDWGRANQFSSTVPFPYIESNHAYVINRWLQPGLGAAYQLQDKYHIMPLFLSMTGDFYKARVTPFYYTNLGYGFAWERTYGQDEWREFEVVRGGLLFHVGGGLKISGREHSVYLKSGYKLQRVYTERDTNFWWGTTGGHENIHRTIRRVYFGLSFAF